MQITANRRTTLVAAAAAIVLIVVVVLVVVLGGDDDTTPGAAQSPSATSTGTGGPPISALPSPSLPASAQATPSAPEPIKTPKPTRVSFDDDVALDNGVSIQVVDIESVKGVARGPGEVAGPALRFTVEVTNRSKKTLDLDLAIVTAYFGKADDPANQLSGPGASALPRKLKVGDSAQGKYVFAIPTDQRGRVRVDFSYIIDQPTIIFRGPGA